MTDRSHLSPDELEQVRANWGEPGFVEPEGKKSKAKTKDEDEDEKKDNGKGRAKDKKK